MFLQPEAKCACEWPRPDAWLARQSQTQSNWPAPWRQWRQSWGDCESPQIEWQPPSSQTVLGANSHWQTTRGNEVTLQKRNEKPLVGQESWHCDEVDERWEGDEAAVEGPDDFLEDNVSWENNGNVLGHEEGHLKHGSYQVEIWTTSERGNAIGPQLRWKRREEKEGGRKERRKGKERKGKEGLKRTKEKNERKGGKG